MDVAAMSDVTRTEDGYGPEGKDDENKSFPQVLKRILLSGFMSDLKVRPPKPAAFGKDAKDAARQKLSSGAKAHDAGVGFAGD
jgi:hypothetical protein